MSPAVAALEARFSVAVGKGPTAFQLDVDLEFDQGTLVLFGRSGSGKSLTLAVLAGLLRPRSGVVRLGDRTLVDVDARVHVPARSRGIGLVPQHHALFPFRNVEQNVAFGLPRARRKGGDAEVLALMEELGLTHLRHALPGSLSGGERQRVALARALAVRPKLLLLDEPFASIDAEGRAELRRTLHETLRRHQMPAVFVTHDVAEARELADHVSLYQRGRSTAVGPTSMLPGGRELRVSGTVRRIDAQDGTSRIELDDAVVKGPSRALEAEPGEAVELGLPID